MLTEEELRFVAYWEQNRNRKKRFIWQLAAGLPLAMVLVGGIFVAAFSDWYSRATMEINVSASGLLVILMALIITIVFVVVFSSRHKWEMNEQRYKELVRRRDRQ